jgi:hypothetical protein
MEPQDSLLHPQEHATVTHPDRREFSPHPRIYVSKIHFNIILSSTHKSPLSFT